jgi:hypothetical protein
VCNCSRRKRGRSPTLDNCVWGGTHEPHYKYKYALIAASAVSALAGTAAAADLAKGLYRIDGYVTQSTCGSIVPTGSVVQSWSYYPGAGAKGMQLSHDTTSATAGAGDAESTVCLATTAVPSGGLNKADLTFNCFNDTDAGEQKLDAQNKSSYEVGASHDPSAWQVSASTALIVSKKTACTYTTDTTWTAE